MNPHHYCIKGNKTLLLGDLMTVWGQNGILMSLPVKIPALQMLKNLVSISNQTIQQPALSVSNTKAI